MSKNLFILLAVASILGVTTLVGCTGEKTNPEDSMESVLKNAHINPNGKSKSQGKVQNDKTSAGDTAGSTGQ
jgi:hypothetical protein